MIKTNIDGVDVFIESDEFKDDFYSDDSVATGLSKQIKDKVDESLSNIKEMTSSQVKGVMSGVGKFGAMVHESISSGLSESEEDQLTSVKVEFGVEISSDMSIKIVKASSKATLKITTEWKNQ